MPFSLLIALITAILSVFGIIQGVIGSQLLSLFLKKAKQVEKKLRPDYYPKAWPKISVLKPLHGEEPLLEEALESLFEQDYPYYEILFGVHSPDDASLPIIRKLQDKYPNQKIEIIINSKEYGQNRKISNLINIADMAHYDIFVIADSDIHVSQNYLKSVVGEIFKPNAGLVTTLYAGLPASNTLIRQLGAASINNNFLPGVLMARLLGRQDCLGATMALKKTYLEKIGGFKSLCNEIIDDSILGQKIKKQGLDIVLAPTLCKTTIGETQLSSLFSHERRWGKTVGALEPIGYLLSSLQLPLFWASLTIILFPFSSYSWIFFGIIWCLYGIINLRICHLTQCFLPNVFPYLLFRDWFSVTVMVSSFFGSHASWQGRQVKINKTSSKSNI